MAERAADVIVVEDNDALRLLMQRTLERAGSNVVAVGLGAEALDAVSANPDAVVVLDYLLPDLDGRRVLDELGRHGLHPPVIIMTAYGDEQVAVELLKAGAQEYLVKDERAIAQLPKTVARVAAEAAIQAELRQAEMERALNLSRVQSMLRIHQLEAGSVTELLDVALEEAIALTGSSIGYIYLYDETSRQFTLNTWSKGVMKDCEIAQPQTVYNLDTTGIWGEAVRQRKAIVVNDFAAPDPLKKGYPAGHAPLHKYATVPVLRGSAIVAVVGVANKQSDYTDLDIAQLTLLMGSVWSVVEQQRAEEALRETTEKYQQLFELGSDAVFLVDNTTGQIVEANATASEMYGYTHEELLAMRNDDLSAEPEKTHAATTQTPAGRVSVPIRWHKRKDGVTFPVEITGRFFTWKARSVHVAAIRDISERVKAEQERERLSEQLRQSQKLESIGQLAGGVAHDFNNILNGIVGFTALLQRKFEAGSKQEEYAQRVHDLAMRAAGLTRQLLAFARKARVEMMPTEINGCIERVVAMLGHTIDKQIEIHSVLCDPDPVVVGDAGEIEHALLNMGLNARDAMPGGGTLTISSAIERVDDPSSIGWADGAPGTWAVLRVTDTGKGMDAATQTRIFEPFFTTKGQGDGAGLGLAAVYGVVKQHGGHIAVRSAPGEGTTFVVYLPLASVDASEPQKRSSGVGKRAGRILFVDDEEDVRASVGALLTDEGYQVVACANGSEAVAAFAREPLSYAAIVLDLMMPVMSGAECFAKLRAARADVPVVLATGYGDRGQQQRILAQPRTAMLAKPYTIEELVKTLMAIVAAQ